MVYALTSLPHVTPSSHRSDHSFLTVCNQIDTVECWLLEPPEEEPGDGAAGGGGGVGRKAGGGVGGGGSVLSKAAEDRVIMELAGMKMHSAGLRDEPLEEA